MTTGSPPKRAFRVVDGLVFGLVVGLVVGLSFGLSDDWPWGGWEDGLVFGATFGLFGGLLGGLVGGGLFVGLVVGLVVGLIGGLDAGLDAWAYHYWLRWRLRARGVLPARWPSFLEWCAHDERNWLRIADDYEFRHREVLEHLAPSAGPLRDRNHAGSSLRADAPGVTDTRAAPPHRRTEQRLAEGPSASPRRAITSA